MKLTLERIVDAGMATFAERGYAGLSMRHVAERLDVHAGSLYYHVRNKEALLRLLADRVASEAYAAGTEALGLLPDSAGWDRKLDAQLDALRTTLLKHDGGPFLLAASPVTLSPGALSLMERLLTTLREADVPPGDRPVAADALLSYVTGFVLQEQVEPTTAAPGADDIAALTERFPMTMSSEPAYENDDLFRKSLTLQYAAIATLTKKAWTDEEALNRRRSPGRNGYGTKNPNEPGQAANRTGAPAHMRAPASSAGSGFAMKKP